MLYPAGGYCAEYFPLIGVPVPPIPPSVTGGAPQRLRERPTLVQAFARIQLPVFVARGLAESRLPVTTAQIDALMPAWQATLEAQMFHALTTADVVAVLGPVDALGIVEIRPPTRAKRLKRYDYDDDLVRN